MCTHDPRIYKNLPIGMYHCPECGEMVIAGLEHQPPEDDMNPKMTSNDFDVFDTSESYATYGNLNRGDTISNGDHFGIVEEAIFDLVLVNWQGINPLPLPPVYYPKDIWNFRFGSNYKIVKAPTPEAS